MSKKKLLEIVALMIIQMISYFLLKMLGLETFFAIWAGIYGSIFFTKLFKLEGMHEFKGGYLSSGRGNTMNEVMMSHDTSSYDTAKSDIIAQEINNKKRGTLFLKRGEKWIYLLLALSNACVSFVLIKLV